MLLKMPNECRKMSFLPPRVTKFTDNATFQAHRTGVSVILKQSVWVSFWFSIQFKIEWIENGFEEIGFEMENFVPQLNWMIHRDSQEGLTKISYENCDRIQKYGPSLGFFSISLLLPVSCSNESSPAKARLR